MQSEQHLFSNLLLYLMLTNLPELSENDLRDYLELMLLAPAPEGSETLRQEIHGQLDRDTLELETIGNWPDDYASLLPACMEGYGEVLERFEQIYAEVSDQEADSALLRRFRACLQLLTPAADWEQRSEAARGIASLEEEVYQLRDDHLARPLTVDQARPPSVIAYRALLDGAERWQSAFRLLHCGKLEEAEMFALDASRLWRSLERWGAMFEILLWEASVLGAKV